jgi:hypothetical protein
MAAGDGLVTMTPTSVSVTGAGSSATIAADGSVDFTSAETLSLNSVFSSAHDNYCIVIRCSTAATTNVAIQYKLRAAGTDTTGSDYTYQYLEVTSTSVGGARAGTQTIGRMGQTSNTQRSGAVAHFYGPYLAQPTASRSVTVGGLDSAYIQDQATTHSLSTSYDGITISLTASNMTGNVVVFGYEE